MPMLVANLPLLGGYDAIVTPERTTAVIRKFGLKHPRLVYTQHGAGDRAGPFEPRLGAFDLVFATGAKQRDRMVGEGLVRAESCVVVGYPKFDLVDALAEPPPHLFDDDRPVVIYNPHFDPSVSSWPRWGLQVLRAFLDDQRHNLIFAPHIRLFEGASRLELEALAPFRGRRNIHIDLGGPASVDMTYTRMADVYLGDVSSQVYEFLRRPRPCVHLNAHAVDWRGDESYRHWRFGPVLETPAGLADAIDRARALHGAYAAIQEEGFRFSFDLQPRSSSRRSAEAIADLLQRPERR
jgi:CDP-glycerol glycerophosphotransferase (TagB/SpsB family)